MPSVYQSRWGFHPCNYETFLLLKRLNELCERARRRFAEWQRWNRKQPQNRVVRTWLVDERGRRVGSRVVGPRPEPPLCPVFCERRQAVRYHSPDGGPPRRQEVTLVCFTDHDIPAAYRAARMPAPSPEQVTPLPLPAEVIRQLAARAGALAE